MDKLDDFFGEHAYRFFFLLGSVLLGLGVLFQYGFASSLIVMGVCCLVCAIFTAIGDS